MRYRGCGNNIYPDEWMNERSNGTQQTHNAFADI